jgi:hypothetical protein
LLVGSAWKESPGKHLPKAWIQWWTAWIPKRPCKAPREGEPPGERTCECKEAAAGRSRHRLCCKAGVANGRGGFVAPGRLSVY